ncbi:caffeine-induced death protein Cid2 [Histoplasma ohiense]|uniref:Caffeine-induced death protein Cid2 n=1 Tax=Ajellomyces capsulatus (strain H88) TaxID=544711 RepID=A0A8A1L725_AJEC8|nr:caffeine-induced death protein Cid2 [Histoplasma ohiense (nom. inval.)]QSS49291.1 caffeine-induced death protein Cid2 [Histoplasma capsulatum var. duboisii H88]
MRNWFWAKLSPSDDVPSMLAKREMSRPLSQPYLSPQFCFNERALRDFLRISRSTIDDSITQNLNALLTPAQKGFDLSITTTRQTDYGSKGQIEPEKCKSFQNNVLFPSWQNRSDVLNYCAGVATSPDPDDPELLLRQGESAKDRERVVDERLDPYSARFFPREARTESLAMLLRNERGVERIIRSRTWGLVTERCGGLSVRWEDALDRWREEQDRKK